jgi:hypothetical protein
VAAAFGANGVEKWRGYRAERDSVYRFRIAMTAEAKKDEREVRAKLIDDLFFALEMKASRLVLTDEDIARWFSDTWPAGWVEEEWKNLKPRLEEEHGKQDRERRRRFLETAVRGQLISEWIEQNLKAETEISKEVLKSEIEAFLKEDWTERLREYLRNVLELGPKKARRKLKRKRWGDGGYLGHAGVVLKGIARVIIVAGVFAVAESKFQTIIFALLIMTHESIESAFLANGRGTTEMGIGIDNQFKRIRRLLREEEPEEDREARVEAEEELLKNWGRGTIRFYIHGFFLLLVWAITLWKLLTAIF